MAKKHKLSFVHDEGDMKKARGSIILNPAKRKHECHYPKKYRSRVEIEDRCEEEEQVQVEKRSRENGETCNKLIKRLRESPAIPSYKFDMHDLRRLVNVVMQKEEIINDLMKENENLKKQIIYLNDELSMRPTQLCVGLPRIC
jgi:hypothetical protein